MRFAMVMGAALLSLCSVGCGDLDTVVLSEERTVALPKPVVHPSLRQVPLAFEHIAKLPSGDVEPEAIDSVRLTRLEILIPDPSPTRNFDFLQELKVYVQTPTTPSRIVATKTQMQPQASVVTLDVRDTELRDYLATPDSEIRVQFLGNQPNEQISVQVEVDFLVDIKIKEVLF